MKTTIAVLALVLSFSAFACQGEAQFIGKATDVRVNEKNECVFQVGNYSWFGESMVCPLFIGEVGGVEFVDASCSLKNGDSVSGVFVRVEDKIVIE